MYSMIYGTKEPQGYKWREIKQEEGRKRRFGRVRLKKHPEPRRQEKKEAARLAGGSAMFVWKYQK